MTQDSSGEAEVIITPGFGDTESMTQPASVSADATSPQGAAVDYPLPAATDAAGVTAPSVSCTPGSGSVFPIGITDVTCTAVDADASPSSVSVQFTVTVTGAMPQLADLGQAVHGISGGKALGALTAAAQSALTAGRPALASLDLVAFVAAVDVLRASHALPAARAQTLTADARQILAVLGH